jgi:hypothetical protein
MKIRQNILLIIAVFVALLLNSCSNTKFLTGDQILYNGRKVEIISAEKGKMIKPAEEIASEVSFAELNNSLMGRRILPPIGLWFYTYRKPEEGKRGGFLYRSFKKNPVLIKDVNPDLRSRKIESDLFANGYFNSKAGFRLDTARNNERKAKIVYSVEIEQPYRLSQILNPPANDSTDVLINKYTPNLNLKPGDIFNLETIRNEKRKLASMLVEEGYYFFSPNEIEIIADTTQTPYTINLLVRKKPQIEPFILKKYSINRVEVNVKQTNKRNRKIFYPILYFTTGFILQAKPNT